MITFILHRVFGRLNPDRRGLAGAMLLVFTGFLAACGGGGGGGGSPPPPAATLKSIAVTPANPSVIAALTTQLTATGTYSDGTSKDLSSQVAWTSSAGTIATVSATGLATGVAAGSATISATLTGVVGNDTLTVTAPTLTSIAITPLAPTIAPGVTLQFTATGKYNNATTQDLTTSVTWGATNSAVATISPTTGLATAVGQGTTPITGVFNAAGPTITPVTLAVNATVYAYATNFDDGTVSQYVIGTGGALAPLSTATVAAGTKPFAVSVEPTGQYVYVANFAANTVSEYTRSNGLLTPVGATGTVASGAHPNGVTIDLANKHAYVVNFGDNTVSQYNIDTIGALTPMAIPTVPTGSFPASIVISRDHKYAYVANFACSGPGCVAAQGTISQYTVGADGALTPMTPAAVNTGSATSQPNSLIVDSTSAHLYVANAGDGNVSQFNIGAGGGLTFVGSVNAGTYPFSVTIDPSGRYAYVANTGGSSNSTVAGSISQYTINASTGVLTPMATAAVPAGIGASSVTVDPTGSYVYATNRGESSLSQFTIAVGGALIPMAPSTVASGLHPTSIATGY
jgi:6-phosphogluconolactonase (cycloisomerase 2 family)